MSIKIRNLVIDYGNSVAVDNLSMSIETGELVSLLGPSGCGKTTTLNAIAGLLQVSSGQILFDGVDVTKRSPQHRNIGLVFQNYALYPHLSVFQNIAFPLYQNNKYKREIQTNNKLIKLKMADVKNTGSSLENKLYKVEYFKILNEFWNAKFTSFEKITDKFLKEVNLEADEKAITIYGDKELNAFRSRMYILWFDTARAQIEKWKLNTIIAIENVIKNNHKTSEKNALIDFAISQFLAKTNLDFKTKTKNKYNFILKVAQQHAKTLKDEIKAIESLSKRQGTNIAWKVSREEKDALVNNFELFYKNVCAKFETNISELYIEDPKQNFYAELEKVVIEPTTELIENWEEQLSDLKSQIKHFRSEVKKSVLEIAEKVEITSQLKKKPSELSGGQQQRVAIARAIVKKPSVLLLDEPLSNLDAKLRVSTREWIKKFQQQTGITTIFVTHDQEEAMSISDKIFIMQKGVLQQADKPLNIYKKPVNRFVANFIGTPSMNFFTAMKSDGTGNVIYNDNLKLFKVNKKFANRPLIIGVRPEHIEINHADADLTKYINRIPFEGKIEMIEQLGRTNHLKVQIEDNKKIDIVYDVKISQLNYQIGDQIQFNLLKGSIYVFATDNNKELLEVI